MMFTTFTLTTDVNILYAWKQISSLINSQQTFHVVALQENAVQHMAYGQMHNIIWGTNSALAWIVIDMHYSYSN